MRKGIFYLKTPHSWQVILSWIKRCHRYRVGLHMVYTPMQLGVVHGCGRCLRWCRYDRIVYKTSGLNIASRVTLLEHCELHECDFPLTVSPFYKISRLMVHSPFTHSAGIHINTEYTVLPILSYKLSDIIHDHCTITCYWFVAIITLKIINGLIKVGMWL